MTPWKFIDDAAARLGVHEAARKKWRYRGVPHRWRLPILQEATKARFKLPMIAFDGAPERAEIEAEPEKIPANGQPTRRAGSR